jgi:hypothetical protein
MISKYIFLLLLVGFIFAKKVKQRAEIESRSPSPVNHLSFNNNNNKDMLINKDDNIQRSDLKQGLRLKPLNKKIYHPP